MMANRKTLKPIEPFLNQDEVIQKLREYYKTHIYPVKSKKNITDDFLSGNIFRAFRGLSISPSKIFRSWAKDSFEVFNDELNSCQKYSNFTKIIDFQTDHLIKFWKESVDKSSELIGFGPASKVVNLMAKDIYCINSGQNRMLEHFLHVPFDNYTLSPLRYIINDISSIDYKIKITPNSSMAYIVNREHYYTFQEAIRKITITIKIPPIIYEYMCWNSRH